MNLAELCVSIHLRASCEGKEPNFHAVRLTCSSPSFCRVLFSNNLTGNLPADLGQTKTITRMFVVFFVAFCKFLRRENFCVNASLIFFSPALFFFLLFNLGCSTIIS
jgi:hypothetical protein